MCKKLESLVSSEEEKQASHSHSLISILLNIPGASCNLWSSSMQLSPESPVLLTLAASDSPGSWLCLLSSDSLLVSTSWPCPGGCLKTVVPWGSCKAHLICFLPLRDHCLGFSVLTTTTLYILSNFLVVLDRRVSSVSVIPSWLKMQVQ